MTKGFQFLLHSFAINFIQLDRASVIRDPLPLPVEGRVLTVIGRPLYSYYHYAPQQAEYKPSDDYYQQSQKTFKGKQCVHRRAERRAERREKARNRSDAALLSTTINPVDVLEGIDVHQPFIKKLSYKIADADFPTRQRLLMAIATLPIICSKRANLYASALAKCNSLQQIEIMLEVILLADVDFVKTVFVTTRGFECIVRILYEMGMDIDDILSKFIDVFRRYPEDAALYLIDVCVSANKQKIAKDEARLWYAALRAGLIS